MNQVMQGKEMSVFGDGLQTRAFSHIDDVAPIIAKSPKVEKAINQTFNIGADKPYSVLELAKEVAMAFEAEPQVKHLPARNEVVHAFSDHSKVADVFGHQEHISLHDGVKRMADWVKVSGPKTPVVFENIEVRKNLPPSWA